MKSAKSLFRPVELERDPRLVAVTDSHDRWRDVATRLSYLHMDAHLRFLKAKNDDLGNRIAELHRSGFVGGFFRLWLIYVSAMIPTVSMDGEGVIMAVLSMTFFSLMTHLSMRNSEHLEYAMERQRRLRGDIEDVKMDMEAHRVATQPPINSIRA